jgi:hypothetical protein
MPVYPDGRRCAVKNCSKSCNTGGSQDCVLSHELPAEDARLWEWLCALERVGSASITVRLSLSARLGV